MYTNSQTVMAIIRRTMRKIIIAAVFVLAITACGSDSSEPTLPAKPSVTGTWRATVTGSSGTSSNITVTLNHDTISNAITGSGSFSQGTASAVLTVQGFYATPQVTLTMSAQGFQSMTATATHNASQIVGTLNGSGFSNAALVLSKQ
jgi:hypothetical protein